MVGLLFSVLEQCLETTIKKGKYKNAALCVKKIFRFSSPHMVTDHFRVFSEWHKVLQAMILLVL